MFIKNKELAEDGSVWGTLRLMVEAEGTPRVSWVKVVRFRKIGRDQINLYN